MVTVLEKMQALEKTDKLYLGVQGNGEASLMRLMKK